MLTAASILVTLSEWYYLGQLFNETVHPDLKPYHRENPHLWLLKGTILLFAISFLYLVLRTGLHIYYTSQARSSHPDDLSFLFNAVTFISSLVCFAYAAKAMAGYPSSIWAALTLTADLFVNGSFLLKAQHHKGY